MDLSVLTLYKYNNFNPFGNKTPLMFQISILYLYKFHFEFCIFSADSYHHAKAWDFSRHIYIKNPVINTGIFL